MLKISSSIVGAWLRVIASVQPVHSWKLSQITDGRAWLSSACAMRGAIAGGRAISDAREAQYFMKPRRLTPWTRI